MTKTKFLLPVKEEPDLVTLLIWCDWLEDRGGDARTLREIISNGNRPGFNRSAYGHNGKMCSGWVWGNEEYNGTMFNQKDTCIIDDELWDLLEHNLERLYRAIAWKSYRHPSVAWWALARACGAYPTNI